MTNHTQQSLIGTLASTPGSLPVIVDDAIAALINDRISPPEPVTPRSIHVRSLRLVSDEVNDHGGRFPAEEHERLCELIVDSPVLVGHDRSQLPVARNFAARSITDGADHWVQVWFYWMRNPDGDQLAADIDGGVVKEGSIGFEFRRPQCSICGNDIRRCEHIPGERYRSVSGDALIAHYEYRDIVRVLETSLVYRGANPGTRLGNEPVFCKQPAAGPEIPVLGLILGRTDLPTGCREYLAARRDLSDPSICDEFTITTRADYRVGDLIRRSGASWETIACVTRQSAHVIRYRQVLAFACGRTH